MYLSSNLWNSEGVWTVLIYLIAPLFSLFSLWISRFSVQRDLSFQGTITIKSHLFVLLSFIIIKWFWDIAQNLNQKCTNKLYTKPPFPVFIRFIARYWDHGSKSKHSTTALLWSLICIAWRSIRGFPRMGNPIYKITINKVIITYYMQFVLDQIS